MKKNILILLGFLTMCVSYGQTENVSGEMKIEKDEFTYKKINVVDKEYGNLLVTGGNNISTSSKSSNTSSANSLSKSSSSSGIGETMGELSVSLTGGAQYNIPIAVPPGINGIMPEISLSYNSQGGNGLAGYGWNISGISSISRIASTMYHDGEIDGVDFDQLDRFSLDGERLVLKSGTYGTGGAVYETENYSNLKVVSYGTSPYANTHGPEYFIVYYPDGSLAHYGNSSNSRTILNYSITYWQNPQGVRINYEYNYNTSSGSNRFITKITYGSLNSTNPINEIRFFYSGLDRNDQAYVNGVSLARSRVLEYIEVYSNNTRFRRYNLNHDSSNLNYKKLTSVTEISGDGTLSHSPISFNYSNSNSQVNYNGVTTDLGVININQTNSQAVSLDLTGNGKMDFVVYPNSKNKFWMFWDIQNGSYNYPYEVTTGVFETVFPSISLKSQNKIFEGQGLTVVQKGSNNTVNFKVYSKAPPSTGVPIAYDYTKTWNSPYYYYDNTPTSSTKKDIPMEYLSGDFNGDGITDVLAIGKPYTSRYCSEYPCPGTVKVMPVKPCPYELLQKTKKDPFSKHVEINNGQNKKENLESFKPPIDPDCGGSSNCYLCSTYTVNYKTAYFINLKRDVTTGFINYSGTLQQSIANGDRLNTGDFNGDGKTDIMHVTNGKIFVYGLNSNNVLTLLWETPDSSLTVTYPLLLGDYNGDGLTDFMKPTANDSYTFKTYLSTGKTFIVGTKNKPFKYQQTNWNGNNGVLTGYNLVPVDINGDGKTDIIEYTTTTYNNSTNGTQVVKIHNNMGLNGSTSTSGFEKNIEFVYGGSATKTGNLTHFPIPIFLSSNQPNKSLDFASISDRWVTNFSFTQDHKEDVLIRSINNNGVTQTIEYNNLDPLEYNSEYIQVYQSLYDETYPNVNINISPTTKVVSKLERISSGAITLKKLYAYYGAAHNAEGLGFLGFKGIAQSNWHTNSSDRIYNISKYDTSLRGVITNQYSLASYYTFTVPSSNYISKTTHQYSSSLALNKVFKTWVTSSLTQNALEGTNTNVSYLYDSYNNPTKITTDYLGTGNNVVDFFYDDSPGSNYYIGRPTKRIETNTIGGESFSTTKEFFYTGHLLTQLKQKGDGTPFNVEDYIYDSFGNIIKKTVTPYGEVAREVEFLYDTSGRFLVKSIDIEDLETIYQYNVNTGTISKEINPFSQVTNFTYDSWNRPIKVTDYLGNDVTTTYLKYNYSYTVINSGDDGSGEISVYDPLKRLITSKSKDVLGQWVNTSYQYDKFDRPWKVSEPYINGGATQWNETEYDFYGRPIKLTEFTGKVTNISYSGLTTTVNDGTKTVTTTKDAMGNVVSVTDPGGTINYSYFGNGNLKSANYGGVIVLLEQDGWGRKTKLTDPSAGVYTYTYNGFGEITNETTPKGTTSYTYSSVGKLTQKLIVGDNTNMTLQYGYNTINKFLASITQSSTDGNNASHSYTYDTNQRLASLTESNQYAQFIKQYTYDNFDRIDTEEYFGKLLANNKTSTKKVKNIYQYGGLKTIQDFTTNEVLLNISQINARGQATKTTMGTNMTRVDTYDDYGYLTRRSIDKPVGPNMTFSIMYLVNDFNVQRGTLNSRINGLFSWFESFTYDSLDRLINFNDNNGNNNNTYDLLGRIIENSEVGDYTYTGNSYQVNSVDLNNQGDFYFQNKALQQITYNAFKKPFEINQDGIEKIGFQYNAFMGRSHMFYGDTNSIITQRNNRKHYSDDGSMEISYDATLDKTTFVTYVGGDAYSAPAIWRSEQQGGSTSEDYYYLHRDYLGSILMISDGGGNAKEKRHFDAWGNIVKLTDGNGNNLDKFVYLDRGYTGHEHLQGVNLIHMNGRLYDPKLKRFLAPDNYIQDIGNTQNFNRYSYVLNNPLMYIDPSGETYGDPIYGGTTVSGPESSHNERNPFRTSLIASAAYSLYNLVNWKGLRFNDIDNWVTKQINSIKGLQIGRWIKGWFKKKSAKPVEYANYEGLSSDPLAGSSATIPTSFFSGGGAEIGGLGISLSDVGSWIQKQVFRADMFAAGFRHGAISGVESTWDFIKGLGTKQGWEDLGQGVVDLGHLLNQSSFKGMQMRTQISNNISNYISNIPNMSAYEMGYDVGFATEKVVESVVLTRGAGFAVNATRVGFGQAMWKSSTFGYKSTLFGRYHPKYLPNGQKGILNTGRFRTGWGNFAGRDVFRTSIGHSPGNIHIDWFFRN